MSGDDNRRCGDGAPPPACEPGGQAPRLKPEDLYGAEVEDQHPREGGGFFNALARAPKRAVISFIRFYQKAVSPLFPRTCRFVPSCSQYAIIAVQRYGLAKGGLLAVKRLLKCGPWHPGGYDPVP
ncbi:MAG: membrane protein insertion efficiency factor YidD [Coriobacteriales bacterium]